MKSQKETQKALEKLHNKNLLMKRIFTEIKADAELQQMIEESGCDPELTTKVLAFMSIYKRLDPSTLIAILYKPHGKYRVNELCAKVEDICQHKFMHYDFDKGKFIVRFELNSEVQKELDIFQFPLPLIVKPRLLKHNMSNGYYCKPKESVLLNKHFSQKDVNLDHLNLMNQLAFSINTTVLAKAVNTWKENSDQTQSQIDRFNRSAKHVYKLIMENGNKFFFNHRADYRGRTYNQGYQLNYQGNDYCKAILEFANKELVD